MSGTIPPHPPHPPPPPPPPAPGGTPPPLPSVTVVNPPSALTSLPAGAQIEATVATTDGLASVRVETGIGSLQLETPISLEKGSILNLILQSLGPRVQLQIATINGKLPHIALRGFEGGGLATGAAMGAAQKATPQTGPQAFQHPGAAATVSPTAAQGVNALVGTTVTATLLRPPAMAATPVLPGQTTPMGSPVTTPTATTPPLAGTTGFAVTPSKSLAGAPATPATGAGPVTIGQATQPLVRGTQLPVRIATVKLPGPDAPMARPSVLPTSASPLPGQLISATVTGSATGGHAVVQTPLGPMTLPLGMTLPRGTQLTIEITDRPILPGAERAALLPMSAQSLFRARNWPAMREVFQALQEADPAMAQHLASAVLPRADTQLAASIIFFLSALRGGDVSGWLGGDALRALQKARPNLATRTREEFREIGGMSAKPMSGDWRIALIPFFNGSDIEQARLFMRPYGGDDAKDEGSPKGTRFIIDVDLSRFGRMQLDGLVKDANKHLDLIVRSDEPLPSAMQNDIRTIFREANELIGIEGGLTFQAAPANFVEIAPDEDADEGSDLFA